MQLENFIDPEEFVREISEELTDLTKAMLGQTARVGYYGLQFSKAKKQAATVDLTFKSIDAKLTTTYREKLEAAAREEVDGTNKSPTRVTAEMVKASVHLDPNYLKWAKLKIDADEIESVCRIALDAFKTRRDMLISLGQMARAEMQGNNTVQGAIEAAARHRARLDERRQQQQQVPVSSA